MNLLDAIILGLVEGITEYLPISSTGHLIITRALLGLDAEQHVRHALDTFIIVIQGGAILAVLGLYRVRIKQMVLGLLGRDRAGLRLAINIVIAFLPAAILGVLLDEIIETHLFSVGPVVGALALGGVWMIVLDFRPWRRSLSADRERAGAKGKSISGAGASESDSDDDNKENRTSDRRTGRALEDLTPVCALFIGLLQCLAMWPGTSRSMMTIAGGMMLGLKPRAAAEFSFLLGLPTLGGACVYKLYGNLLEAYSGGQPSMIETLGVAPVLVGIGVATVSAALAIGWLVAFLTNHGLAVFGYYRLILSAMLLIMVLRGSIQLAVPTDAATVDQPLTPEIQAPIRSTRAAANGRWRLRRQMSIRTLRISGCRAESIALRPSASLKRRLIRLSTST